MSKFAVTNQQITAAGTYDFTVPGFGEVKACIVMMENASVLDFLGGSTRHSLGFGANNGGTTIQQCCCSYTTSTGQGTTTAVRMSSLSDIVKQGTPNNSVNLRAQLTAFITDGVRLNVSQYDFTRLFHVVLIGGDDIEEVYVGEDSIDNNNRAQNIGFEPDLVLLETIGSNTIDTNETLGMFSVGASINDVGVPQYCLTPTVRNNRSTSNNRNYARNDSCLLYSGTFGGDTNRVTLTSYNAGAGFSLQGTSSSNDMRCFYFAIKWTTPPPLAIVPVTVGASNSYQQTDVGFKPTAAMLFFGGRLNTYNIQEDSNVWSHQTQIFTNEGIGTLSGSHQDNVGTSKAQNWQSDSLPSFLGWQGTLDWVATDWAFTDLGWDINYSSNGGYQNLGFAIAIQGPSGVKNIYKGSDQVDTLKLGANDVSAVYVGTEKVFG